MGLGKFLSDFEISAPFLMSLGVSFFVSFRLGAVKSPQKSRSRIFKQGSRRLGESRILPFDTPTFGGVLKIEAVQMSLIDQ